MGAILGSLFKTYGYRVVGAAVALGVAKLSAVGYDIDQATQTSIALAVYGVVHVFLNEKKPATPPEPTK